LEKILHELLLISKVDFDHKIITIFR